MHTKVATLNLATVILFFNKPALTLRCLQSTLEALAKTRAPDFPWHHQFFLVDNGSTAQNRLLIETEVKSLAQLHGQSIEFITLTPNLGFSCGMNAGIARGFADKTDFICALSNDIEVDSGFYTQLLKSAITTALPNQANILCPTVYHLIDRQSLAYTHGHCDLEDLVLSHSKKDPLRNIEFPNYYPGAATIWTAPAFLTLGGFDPSFFCYWEDVSLSFYATIKGVALVPAPLLRVHHLGRGTTGKMKSTSRYFAEGRDRFHQVLKTHLPQYVSRHVREVPNL